MRTTARDEAERILAKDGMSLADYDATVFVFVADECLADSETLEDAKALVKRARGYGEDAWWYVHTPQAGTPVEEGGCEVCGSTTRNTDDELVHFDEDCFK